jgi:hypothetical protein
MPLNSSRFKCVSNGDLKNAIKVHPGQQADRQSHLPTHSEAASAPPEHYPPQNAGTRSACAAAAPKLHPASRALSLRGRWSRTRAGQPRSCRTAQSAVHRLTAGKCSLRLRPCCCSTLRGAASLYAPPPAQPYRKRWQARHHQADLLAQWLGVVARARLR